MLITRDKSGNVVSPNDTIIDFRGQEWTFVRATRAGDTFRSGKVLAHNGTSYGASEFYDNVFDLTVTTD